MIETTQSAHRPEGCEDLCPGCRHRDLSELASLSQKSRFVSGILAPWVDRLAPIVGPGSSSRLGYRDRVCLRVHWNGIRWAAGLMRRDEVVAIPNCPLHSRRVRRAIEVVTTHAPVPSVFPWAFVIVNAERLVFVLKSAKLPSMDWITDEIWSELQASGIRSLGLNLNPSAGNRVVDSKRWHLIKGDEVIGWGGFEQQIPSLSQNALEQARQHLAPAPDTRVLDFYSGSGASVRLWEACGATALGVELSAEGVAYSQSSLRQSEVLRGRVENRIPQFEEWISKEVRGQSRLLHTNPPRPGMSAAVLQWILKSYRPERISYQSCSPGTLSRDLKILEDGGYQIERLLPFDFFPLTHHVEVLALLRLRQVGPKGQPAGI